MGPGSSPPPSFSEANELANLFPCEPTPFAEPAPLYDLPFNEAYKHWKSADDAFQAISHLSSELNAIQPRLKDCLAELEVLKENSASAFKAQHPESRQGGIFSRFLPWQKSKDGAQSNNDEFKTAFDSAHAAEMKKLEEVEQLQFKVEEIVKKKDELLPGLSRLDDSWAQLHHTFETLPSTPCDASLFGAAEDRLLASETAYSLATSVVKDITRGRLTIQHAHLYYNKAVRLVDDIRGTAVSRTTVGAFGAIGTMHGYRAAGRLAEKSQVCLNEFFRVMEPHIHLITDERRVDYNELKALGLLQVLKIYNLLYGGGTSTVGDSVKLMLNKQDRAFEHLTRLAVWVQDRVLICEGEKTMAETRRNDARRGLAHLWIESQGDTNP